MNIFQRFLLQMSLDFFKSSFLYVEIYWSIWYYRSHVIWVFHVRIIKLLVQRFSILRNYFEKNHAFEESMLYMYLHIAIMRHWEHHHHHHICTSNKMHNHELFIYFLTGYHINDVCFNQIRNLFILWLTANLCGNFFSHIVRQNRMDIAYGVAFALMTRKIVPIMDQQLL
jgi:hypothetical protein